LYYNASIIWNISTTTMSVSACSMLKTPSSILPVNREFMEDIKAGLTVLVVSAHWETDRWILNRSSVSSQLMIIPAGQCWSGNAVSSIQKMARAKGPSLLKIILSVLRKRHLMILQGPAATKNLTGLY